ncbi:MAG: glycoside hydrolase family 3 protein [Gammaproteobacteria bacterium]|nr:glycoside hydrolase family 3 protein [Gammaproteobacteria bacterium]NNC97582.1 glycoside hydrolase family 3 protein [Gammaproteobacteria bacterium]NNM14801.1 glycoside hydrolase family 3 protein [Gammaproteobacteria bacterium]
MTTSIFDSATHEKAEALLARMNLDQKIGQMTQSERMCCTPQDVKEFHLGSVLSGGGSVPGENKPSDWVDMNDAYWQASMQEDDQHLAIPLIYGVDAIHGNNNVLGATVFPHNIGLGAANDPELMQRIARVTAREILATGVEWTFAPTLAVARNYHWGRTYESYSENSDLVASYAAPFVKGLQAELGDNSIVACLKHWVGDGGTYLGIDQGNTIIEENELRKIHMSPYLPAIEQGVLTIMASFNSWNGKKCHGHKYLLTDVLKDELGFEGYIISDWDGIDYISKDYYEAVGRGVNAGIDMFMAPEGWRTFIQHVKSHVHAGTIPMSRIDDAVRRILLVKFAYGLFDKDMPSERPWSNHSSFGGDEHRAIAREAVRKSLVLLKNEKSLLPLDKQSRILVAGKNAHSRGRQCGGFTVAWQGVHDNNSIIGGTSIWEGIKAVAPNATLSADGTGHEANPDNHDVAIVVIGEYPYAEGMGDIRDADHSFMEPGSQYKEGFMKVLAPYGDTLELAKLHPEDLATIAHIHSQGIPVVSVLVSGRPLVVNQELEKSTSFVAAWLPGSEGQGVSDVLFGDHDFQGKLSFSWPKDVSQSVLNLGDDDYDPLFAYGYGLSLS